MGQAGSYDVGRDQGPPPQTHRGTVLCPHRTPQLARDLTGTVLFSGGLNRLSASNPVYDGTCDVPREAQPVPTVLQWSMGGINVSVTGSFNHWGERIPLRRSGSDFVVCLNLLPGAPPLPSRPWLPGRIGSNSQAHTNTSLLSTMSGDMRPISRPCATRWATSTTHLRSRTKSHTSMRTHSPASLGTAGAWLTAPYRA